MEVADFDIEYKTPSDEINIYALGDIHIGNINCELKKFESLIDKISKEKNSYVYLMGDLAECIVHSDPRYDRDGVDTNYDDPNTQYDKIKKVLEKMNDRIIAVHLGNHELSLKKYHYFHFTERLCTELSCNYLGYNGFTTLHFRRNDSNKKTAHTSKIEIFSTHGVGGGNLKGSKINKVESLAKSFKADIYLAGHNHDLVCTGDVQIEKRGKNLKQSNRAFALTGTFLSSYKKGTRAYSERSVYNPLRVGCIKLTITPETKLIQMSEVLL